MLVPQFTILYVANPARSTLFYRELFGRPPVEESPTFAMFVFESGARLALWSSATVEPAVAQTAGPWSWPSPSPMIPPSIACLPSGRHAGSP